MENNEKLEVGDKVIVKLKKPYTKKEIQEQGCHPKVDGMTATVAGLGYKDLIELELEKELELHPLNDNCFSPSKIYKEHKRNLEKL